MYVNTAALRRLGRANTAAETVAAFNRGSPQVRAAVETGLRRVHQLVQVSGTATGMLPCPSSVIVFHQDRMGLGAHGVSPSVGKLDHLW